MSEPREDGVLMLLTFILVFTIIACTFMIIRSIEEKSKVQLESTQNISYFLNKILDKKELNK